jgi:hypothetical protein
MESSENTIQPARGPDRAAAGTVYAGTVTGVKNEGNVQTLEVQFSQGKIRFKADGDFSPGEKVRLSFPGHGAVQVEKGAASQGDGIEADYALPRNLSALKDLRGFEENLVAWMGAAKDSPAAANANAGADAQARSALMRLTLPQLMLKIMEQPGGREKIAQAAAGLDPAILDALYDALEATDADALPADSGAVDEESAEPAAGFPLTEGPVRNGAKPALLDLLRTLGQPVNPGEAGRSGSAPAANASSSAIPVSLPVRTLLSADTGAFMPAESGTGHAPWFGRIVDKQAADDFLTPKQRLQFTGRGAPPDNGPMFRYLIDTGGRTLEAYSSQSLEPGAFTDFTLERQGGRVQAVFTDPAASLPAGIRSAMAGASPALRQGIQVAAHYLHEFRGEPYFDTLVEDFGEVLAQSGRLESRAAGGALANAGPAGKGAEKPAGMPDRETLDGLLKLFVAYPRDPARPEAQAKAWGDAVKDPQAMLKLLRSMAPDQDETLLRARTALHLSAETRSSEGTADPDALGSAAGKTDGPEAAALLKKLLPETFRSDELLTFAKDAIPPSLSGKEHEAGKFLLQAVAHAFPREDQIQEGRPVQFYFYQGQEWRQLRVTWEREGGGKAVRGKPGPKAPLHVSVETEAKRMGKVNVAVSWDPKGAKLDFRNQFHDVRDLLARSLPELEKNLALMDFRVTAWTYELIPPEPAMLPDSGWARPGLSAASLRGPSGASEGGGLDVKG